MYCTYIHTNTNIKNQSWAHATMTLNEKSDVQRNNANPHNYGALTGQRNNANPHNYGALTGQRNNANPHNYGALTGQRHFA